MMSGVSLETCWAFNKLWNNKFYYKLHLVGISLSHANTGSIITQTQEHAMSHLMLSATATGRNNCRHRPSGRLQILYLTLCRMLQGKSTVNTLLNNISAFSATRHFISLFIRVWETHKTLNWFIDTQITLIFHSMSTFEMAPYFQGFPKQKKKLCVFLVAT